MKIMKRKMMNKIRKVKITWPFKFIRHDVSSVYTYNYKGWWGGGGYCMILCNKILVWVHQEQASFLCLATMRFIS